jgi:hypothetical protein
VPKVWSGVAWPMASAGTAVCDDSNWNNRGDRSHIARSTVTLRFSNNGVVTASALVRRNPGRPVLAPTGDQGHYAVDDEQRGGIAVGRLELLPQRLAIAGIGDQNFKRFLCHHTNAHAPTASPIELGSGT